MWRERQQIIFHLKWKTPGEITGCPRERRHRQSAQSGPNLGT